MSKPINTSISRQTILDAIGDNIDRVDQWKKMDCYGRCAKYEARADVLISLLEVDDCRSHGGYDTARGQHPPSQGMEGIRQRYEWLKSIS